jgi:hypothetical protein
MIDLLQSPVGMRALQISAQQRVAEIRALLRRGFGFHGYSCCLYKFLQSCHTPILLPILIRSESVLGGNTFCLVHALAGTIRLCDGRFVSKLLLTTSI